MPTHPRPLEERFWEKVNKTDSCWLWTASLTTSGYGRVRLGVDRQMGGAHRVAYEFLVGPIPDGLQLDHLCRVRACVNPAHLEPVTRRENILRGTSPSAIHATRTECINGHPFTEENTYIRVSQRGSRRCRTCHRNRVRERDHRLRSKA